MSSPSPISHLPSPQSPRVAIVCDWLYGGGAERVVSELHSMFPDAPIYTSYCRDEWRAKLDDKVVTGYLQKWPFSRLRKFIPFLRARWFSKLNLKGFDLIISATGAEAKGVRTGKNQTHICYCFAPTHYYWSRYEEYLQNPGFGKLNWLARLGLKAFVKPMRAWDYKAAQRPDHMISISTNIQAQIKKYYGRDTEIIYPPVDTKRFELKGTSAPREGFVITGRQTPYKRIDLAVAACTDLNLPLTVIGNGPEHRQLEQMAGKSIVFLTNVTDGELPRYLQSAEAFIFPTKDDFGIAPVEAMAAGTPVIAYQAGGALEYVIEGKTGLFFKEQTVESLQAVLRTFANYKFSEQELISHANKFSAARFQENLKNLIKRRLS